MTQIFLKRVYDVACAEDGMRVFIDRLWPRGLKKQFFQYDMWAKEIAPSTALRQWFHENTHAHWDMFVQYYQLELADSAAFTSFVQGIRVTPRVTLLYAAKNSTQNHAQVLYDEITARLILS